MTMKSSIKLVSAAIALVAVSAVHATPWSGMWDFRSGTGGLTFSSDALSALSASGSVVIASPLIPGNVTGLPNAGAANTAVYNKATGNVSLVFSSATVVGDTLTSMQAANSLVQIRRTVFDEDNETVTRYNVYLSNFDVNLGNSTIYANLYARTEQGPLTSFGKQAIFTADVPGVVGGTQGNIQVASHGNSIVNGEASGSLAGSLRINGATADIILSSLGLSTAMTDPVATLVRTANWGNTQAAGVFSVACLECTPNTTPTIPEPSTYAMVGVGLLAIGALRRRALQG